MIHKNVITDFRCLFHYQLRVSESCLLAMGTPMKLCVSLEVTNCDLQFSGCALRVKTILPPGSAVIVGRT